MMRRAIDGALGLSRPAARSGGCRLHCSGCLAPHVKSLQRIAKTRRPLADWRRLTSAMPPAKKSSKPTRKSKAKATSSKANAKAKPPSAAKAKMAAKPTRKAKALARPTKAVKGKAKTTSIAKASPKAKANAKAKATPKMKAAPKAKGRSPSRARKAPPRRDGSGRLDPKYARDLRALSRENNGDDDNRAFFKTPRSGDTLAEELGEEAVETMTSGEDQGDRLMDEQVDEERGGPFVNTGGEEFARGTDRSNPADATREPFPRT